MLSTLLEAAVWDVVAVEELVVAVGVHIHTAGFLLHHQLCLDTWTHTHRFMLQSQCIPVTWPCAAVTWSCAAVMCLCAAVTWSYATVIWSYTTVTWHHDAVTWLATILPLPPPPYQWRGDHTADSVYPALWALQQSASNNPSAYRNRGPIKTYQSHGWPCPPVKVRVIHHSLVSLQILPQLQCVLEQVRPEDWL